MLEIIKTQIPPNAPAEAVTAKLAEMRTECITKANEEKGKDAAKYAEVAACFLAATDMAAIQACEPNDGAAAPPPGHGQAPPGAAHAAPAAPSPEDAAAAKAVVDAICACQDMQCAQAALMAARGGPRPSQEDQARRSYQSVASRTALDHLHCTEKTAPYANGRVSLKT